MDVHSSRFGVVVDVYEWFNSYLSGRWILNWNFFCRSRTTHMQITLNFWHICDSWRCFCTEEKIERCLGHIQDWSTSKRLQLNSDKPEIISFESKTNLDKLIADDLCLHVGSVEIKPSTTPYYGTRSWCLAGQRTCHAGPYLENSLFLFRPSS